MEEVYYKCVNPKCGVEGKLCIVDEHGKSHEVLADAIQCPSCKSIMKKHTRPKK